MKRLLYVILCLIFTSEIFSQNVGIGVDTPLYKLDVKGRVRLKTGTIGDIYSTPGIWLEDFRNGTNRVFFGMQDSIRAGFYSDGLLGWNVNWNSRNGFVGMGRLASNYKLELDDNNAGGSLGIYRKQAFVGSFVPTDSTLEVYAKYGNITCIGGSCPAGNIILLPPVPNLSVLYPGNVGIGLNKPLHKLSVDGTVGVYYSNTLLGTLGRRNNDFLINAKTGTTSPVVAAANLILQSHTGASQTSGNVGIGTSAPEEKLDVNGNIRVSGQVNKEAANGTHGMLPIAFARIRGDGFLQGSTGGVTVTRISKGKYQVALASAPLIYNNENQYVVMITPSTAGPYFGGFTIKSNQTIEVQTYKPAIHWTNIACTCELTSRITDAQAYDQIDMGFSLLVYKMY